MRRHVAKVALITPNHFQILDFKNSNAFLAISLSNPNFYGKKLGALFKFLDENFEKIIVLTPGYLYRYYYILLNGLNENQAKEMAIFEEEQYIKTELAVYSHFFSKQQFSFQTWTQNYNSKEFQLSLENIQAFYDTTPKLKEKMHTASVDFLRRKFADKIEPMITDNNIRTCINFFIEEAAMVYYLITNGFNILVYPGAMPEFFMDISNREFNNAPKNLESLIHLEVKLTRIGRRKKELFRNSRGFFTNLAICVS